MTNISVGDLVAGYNDDGEDGVVGYGGKLDIRPPFQREFVYDGKQRAAVIDTINKGFPLNVMYWADRGKDESPRYEIIDGQQRTISVAQYVNGDFSHEELYFDNLPADKKALILDYKLMVYACRGTDSEKLDWFEIINIAGERLTNQELRNAVYAGPWVTDAKRYFSRTGCVASKLASRHVSGRPIRQDYLETAIRWASRNSIEDYMGRHQHDPDAESLWEHFKAIIRWVQATFTEYRPAMKTVDWGPLYDAYGDAAMDPDAIEQETQRLIADDDVQKLSGIYPYILTRDEKHLNLRLFDNKTKQRVYERQDGDCNICHDSFDIKEMQADHITPWSDGGSTTEDNCQMLCRDCNRRKSNK
jgi:hypothetical protein